MEHRIPGINANFNKIYNFKLCKSTMFVLARERLFCLQCNESVHLIGKLCNELQLNLININLWQNIVMMWW